MPGVCQKTAAVVWRNWAFCRKLAGNGFNPREDFLALNQEVAARIERHEPVTAPGLPPGFPEPETLVTEDCIQPPEP